MVVLIIAGLGVGLSLAVPLIIIQAVSFAVHISQQSTKCMLTSYHVGNASQRNGFLHFLVAAHPVFGRNHGHRGLPSSH